MAPVTCNLVQQCSLPFNNNGHQYFPAAAVKVCGLDRSSEEYYQNNASKFWDRFYKRHSNKFFKDRHYLKKDWGDYFAESDVADFPKAKGKVLLEVGCGTGNTIFPLLATYPMVFVHACDISAPAIELVKSHVEYREDRVNAFTCDVSIGNLAENIDPSSVDIVTLVKQIFTLSAVSPSKMPTILLNIKRVLKPRGHVLFRDYAIGDFAQLKLQEKSQLISDDFYVRGDGTCCYYFTEEFLSNLFSEAGFNTINLDIICRRIENRSRDITMERRWVRAIFNSPG